jgi:hypothetical protein
VSRIAPSHPIRRFVFHEGGVLREPLGRQVNRLLLRDGIDSTRAGRVTRPFKGFSASSRRVRFGRSCGAGSSASK